jgi:transposase, IS5 family
MSQTSLIFFQGEAMVRAVESLQMEIGETAISAIRFNPKSRDDIPKILRGLQYIYLTPSIREPIFKLLEEKLLPGVNKQAGRPGLSLWKILVMGVVRLDLNCDYDRLEELVNQHKTVRQMLGHADFSDEFTYHMQTIKDNVRLLTPELLEEVNQVIVKAGHALLGKKKGNQALRGRCDSFVVETHVHYPTDIHLLFDAVRKVIQLTAGLCTAHHISDWRQQAYNVKQMKRQMRITQQKKRHSGQTPRQKMNAEKGIKQAHVDL